MDSLLTIAAFLQKHFSWFLAILLTSVLLVPVFEFFISGWERKRVQTIGNLSDNAKLLYFEQFVLEERNVTLQDANARFANYFIKTFGRKRFIIPVVMFVITSFVVVLFSSITIHHYLYPGTDVIVALPSLALAANSGAYMYVLADLISRNRRLDLTPADFSWASFRFIIAVPFAYALSAMFNESIATTVAFLVGAFPTHTLRRIAQRLASRNLNIGESEEKGVSELERLQGITTTNAEVFADEGVTTILQLAYSDPIDISIRTSFAFSYVVDCMSQALAWIYLEDDMKKLRRFSLRGAQEINFLHIELNGSEEEIRSIKYNEDIAKDRIKKIRSTAADTLRSAALELNMDVEAFNRVVDEIAIDPYTRFLYNTWG